MKSQLIIIAGASRSGKSTLAARLGTLLNCAVFELDVIFRALAAANRKLPLPRAGLSGEMTRSASLTLVHFIARREVSAIVEGGWIEPADAARLAAAYPERDVIVVYLGFPALTVDTAVRRLKMHRRRRLWSWPPSQAEKRAFFEREIAGSQWYREQCRSYGLTFVDTSNDRDRVIQACADDILERLADVTLQANASAASYKSRQSTTDV